MTTIRSTCALLAIATVTNACAAPYEFRSGDRPSFDNVVSAEELVQMRNNGATVLDVRLSEDFAADPELIPDAMYRDPDEIVTWVRSMSPVDGPVIVYCVRGKWVSQKAANYLKDQGFEVVSLEGGIEAWKDAGRETVPAN